MVGARRAAWPNVRQGRAFGQALHASNPLLLPAACRCRYFFSTLLSLFNKIVVGKEHGLLGMGAFPGEPAKLGPFPRRCLSFCEPTSPGRFPSCAAPFLMSSTQFFFQHIIARTVLVLGWVRRKSDGSQSWRDYFRKGGPLQSAWWGS